MFARRGETTPPCGVPSSVGIKMPLSTTPALSHSLRGRAKCGLVCILSRSAAWFILAKQLAISASSTYRGCLLMTSNICSMASWHERPGLHPKLWGSNLASHSGSRASLTSACVARSCMIGRPSGRSSSFPGLGTQILRTGFAGACRSSAEISFSLCGGVRLFPSVFPGHPPHREAFRTPGRGEKFLELAGFLCLSTGRCLIDSSLELAHTYLELAPGDRVPFIPMTLVMAHDISTLLEDSIVGYHRPPVGISLALHGSIG